MKFVNLVATVIASVALGTSAAEPLDFLPLYYAALAPSAWLNPSPSRRAGGAASDQMVRWKALELYGGRDQVPFPCQAGTSYTIPAYLVLGGGGGEEGRFLRVFGSGLNYASFCLGDILFVAVHLRALFVVSCLLHPRLRFVKKYHLLELKIPVSNIKAFTPRERLNLKKASATNNYLGHLSGRSSIDISYSFVRLNGWNKVGNWLEKHFATMIATVANHRIMVGYAFTGGLLKFRLFPNRFHKSAQRQRSYLEKNALNMKILDLAIWSPSPYPAAQELVGPPRLTAPELVDMIIDFLHASPESLVSCALVSSSWRPASQFHLFSDVRISPDLDEYRTDFQTFLRRPSMDTGPSPTTIARFAKFCATLKNSEHLVPLVRTLTIDACTPMLRNLADVSFTHLEAITLFDCRTGLARNEVVEYPVKAQYLELMSRIFAQPTLTRIELYFRDRELEPGYFHYCPNLTSLVLHNISWRSLPGRPRLTQLSPARRPRIESLKIWHCRETKFLVPDVNNSGLDFSSLKHLDLWDTGDNSRMVWDFIKTTRATLEHLAFNHESFVLVPTTVPGLLYSYQLSVTTNPVNLAILPKLTHLELYATIDCVVHRGASSKMFSLPSVLEVLRTLAPGNRLQTLVVWVLALPDLDVQRNFGAQLDALRLPALQRAEMRLWRSELNTPLLMDLKTPFVMELNTSLMMEDVCLS
ncbi:hypothetical protein C8R44DRAFT_919616 [Mycena epipterygia]|nr:hypothetical protein C8R44DRAFT_919616 [Mycena epipterygia]